jgi:small-conductance mechanosensitive channel
MLEESMDYNLFYFLNNLTINKTITEKAFYVSLTILIAIVIDLLLKSLIRVPKHFDNRRARTFTAFVRNIITTIVYIFATYSIFTTLNINLTPLLAYASIVGVIIGISSRSIIEDFVNGIFLLSLDSIAIGDYIKIDDDPRDGFIAEGIVEKIGIRTVSIRSYLDGSLYVIPNGKVKKFINYTRPRSCALIDLIVKADNNIDKTLAAANKALEILRADEELGKYILTDSKVVGIEGFQTFDFMTIRVNLFTPPTRRLDVGRKYRYLAKKEFEKNKIAIG